MVPDITPPSTTDNYNGEWHTTDFTIALSASDYFGVKQTNYRINGGDPKTVAANGQPLITTEGANNTLEYWSTDLFEHEEVHHFLTQIKLDKTYPMGTILLNDGAVYTNTPTVNVTLTLTDENPDTTLMHFSNDNSSWSNWQPFTNMLAWALNNTDGVGTVYVQFKDIADLVSTINASIILDTTLPLANAGSSQTVTRGNSVTFDGSGSSDVSGILSFTWNFGDGVTATGMTATHTYINAGTYSATLTVVDAAGNSAQATVTITVKSPSSVTPAPTTNPTTTPTTTPTPTPSPSPSQNAISVTSSDGTTEQFSISGNITSSQITNAQIQTNETAKTTTISFTVTGETGTTGTGNITIPKSQVPYSSTPIIYIDNQPVDSQGFTEDANNYYVWYTVHFSTHDVTVVFAGETQQANDYTLPIALAAVVVAVCIGIALVVLRKRRKTSP